jgi:hypothetical protein
MPARHARRRAAALVLLMSMMPNLAGCYSYAVTSRTPEPDDRVRARLNAGGRAWLIEQSGRSRDNLEGTFVRSENEHVLMTVWRSDLPGSTQFRTGLDTLRIPVGHVTTFEERRLSIGRTLIAGAVAAGVLGLAIGVMAEAGGSGDGGDGGVVFFRLR